MRTASSHPDKTSGQMKNTKGQRCFVHERHCENLTALWVRGDASTGARITYHSVAKPKRQEGLAQS
jgi:hypothetical protein